MDTIPFAAATIGLLAGAGGTNTGGGLLKTGRGWKSKLLNRAVGGESRGVVVVLSRLSLLRTLGSFSIVGVN